MKPAFPALCAVLAACHAARDTAMLPPNPSSTQAVKSIIDSLLERSKERRAQHERLIAMQEEAAPPEVDEYEEVRASKPTDKCAGHSEPAQTGAAATCLSLEPPGSRERELGSAGSDCRG